MCNEVVVDSGWVGVKIMSLLSKRNGDMHPKYHIPNVNDG
jgi:hypothetical protein